MATYQPTASIVVYNFVQFSSTTGALQTALRSAFTTGFIQVVADTTTGLTSNALVIFNDTLVFTVAPNNWVGYNQGTWSQWTPAQVDGSVTSVFRAYT